MRNFRKLMAMAVGATLSLTMLAGCNENTGSAANNNGNSSAGNVTSNGDDGASSTSDSSAEGGSVYWLNFKPESDGTLQEIAKMYTDKTGVSVNIVTAASGTYESSLTAEMDKSAKPTLFVINSQQAATKWGDYALDLTDTPIANELNTTEYNMYVPDNKLVAIPYCYEAYGIIVNPELIEQAGHKMDEIKNFATLKTVVEDIHSRAADLGFDAFTSSDMDGSSNWRFVGHMANLEYYYEQRYEHWFECPPTITGEYMQNYKNLYDLCINNSLTDPTALATGGHDATNEFVTKKAAFLVQGSWAYADIKDSVPNATMIPYYCGVEGEEKAGLNCGTENCWAINSKCSEADQKATMDFMMWCATDPEASAMLVESFGNMPYKQAPASSNPFLALAKKYEDDGCYIMNWATNFQPNVTEYRNVLTAALNQYNSDQSDANWEAVRTAFVDGWAVQYNATNG